MRRRLLSVVVAVLALSLGACGTAAPVASSHPKVAAGYVELMKKVLADHPSALEERVFADYYVSAAEMKETEQSFAKCMADKGWDVSFSDTGAEIATAGSSNPDPNNGSMLEKANNACGQSYSVIQAIFFGVKTNPLDLTTDQRIQACYKKHKVPDGAGLSKNAFAKLVDGAGYVPSSSVAKMCSLDPDGSQGLTPQDAEKEWAPLEKGEFTVQCDKTGKNCATSAE